MSLIGKLDYPEISAFDYELEQLPEIKPKDKEKATPGTSFRDRTIQRGRTS